MAWIKSLLVLASIVAFSNGLKITKFRSIGGPIHAIWAANSPDDVRADGSESFGLAYASDKVYVVSCRGAIPSAVGGGIVSILDRKAGTWIHKPFDALASDATYVDHLLTLGGRLYLLFSSSTDAIRFHKLFVFDDEQGKWSEVKFDIDPLSSEPLIRSKDKFISINVPDQDGNVAYIGATDHNKELNNSGTCLSKLMVNFDAAKKPLDASLKRIIHLDLPMASAVIATAAKDDKLYVLVSRFAAGLNITPVSIEKVIDLKTGLEITPVPAMTMTPAIDYTQERIVQLKDKVLFLGPHQEVDGKYKRHIWTLDLVTMKMEEADASFPAVPNRVHAFDANNMEVFVAGLKLGVWAAMIVAPGFR